jgi:hypothetical protein
MTMQNINGVSPHSISVSSSDSRSVRRQATDFTNSISQVPLSIASITENIPAEPPSPQILQAGTQVDGSLTDQLKLSSEAQPRARGRQRERPLFSSHPRYASPEPRYVCNGWCKYNEIPHPNVVCIVHTLLASRDLIFLDSSLYPLARIYRAHGKAQMAPLPQSCAVTLVGVFCVRLPYPDLTISIRDA